MSDKFREKVLPLWVVIYDNEPSRTYVYTSPDKMIAAIDGSVRSYTQDDSQAAEMLYQEFVDRIRNNLSEPFIPVVLQLGPEQALAISIVKFELDCTTKFHAVLSECFGAIYDSDLRAREHLLQQIAGLFAASSGPL